MKKQFLMVKTSIIPDVYWDIFIVFHEFLDIIQSSRSLAHPREPVAQFLFLVEHSYIVIDPLFVVRDFVTI